MDLNKIKNKTTWNDAASSLNDNFAKLKQAIALGSLGTSAVMLDTEMSDESENVVQNKVIKKYVDDEIVTLEGYAEEVVNNLENNIKTNPSEYVKLKTINGKSLYGSGNIVIEGGGGGSGLQYAVERTVYLTEIHEDGDDTLEITEEERAYNIETVNKVFEGFDAGNQKVFISLFGTFYFFQYGRISDDKKSATFGNVTEYEGVLHSMKVTITSEGDAIAEATQIQTGGSVEPELLEGYMPLSRDFSDDFNNDFAR